MTTTFEVSTRVTYGGHRGICSRSCLDTLWVTFVLNNIIIIIMFHNHHQLLSSSSSSLPLSTSLLLFSLYYIITIIISYYIYTFTSYSVYNPWNIVSRITLTVVSTKSSNIQTNTSFVKSAYKSRGQKLITGNEILHFNNLIICESGDLASGEILDQRNSGGSFMALAFDKVAFQPIEATQPSVAYDPVVVAHDPHLVCIDAQL